jgi:two-component system, chemotaxis family, CheB/CheR fusion protein
VAADKQTPSQGTDKQEAPAHETPQTVPLAEGSTASAREDKPLDTEGKSPRFPIVAIGASAGSLDALEQFFTNMPDDSGMAFVLVQHLDPTHKSILVDLVNRYTPMKVIEVQDGMKVEPNCAYIIPPNRDMAILHRTLQLLEPSAPRGLRLPIDYFFRSLAQDQQELAICIVLSGTGTDGTLGLKAVKEVGGMAMVQEPESASYDGMPRSAIATGLVDFVLPPEKMMVQLITYAQHAFVPETGKGVAPSPKGTDNLKKIFVLLRAQIGHDFSFYKPNTISRRIERRMTVNQIEHIGDYVRYLQKNPSEIETLFKELLIGVSNFFRDPQAFDLLARKAIPAIFKNKDLGQPVRMWVPGCATGEEAYSIAILLREQMEMFKREVQVQVFATDIDSKAIETARTGTYPDSITVDVSPQRLSRFFTKEDNTYQVNKVIRDMLVFAEQNVIQDPPFSRLDLISCRNLLIYMGVELQKKVLQLLHYALDQDGYLFLGTSESIGEQTELFDVVDRKWKLFQRKGEGVSPGLEAHLPTLPLTLEATGRGPLEAKIPGKPSLRDSTERLLLEDYAPSCVIVNEKGDVLYIHGRTGKYLEPAPGQARMNIVEMAREGLQLELTTTVRKALAEKKAIRCNGLRVKANGEEQVIDLTVKPMKEQPGSMLVVFEEAVPQPPGESLQAPQPSEKDNRRVAELQRELRSTKEYLQTSIEELETSNEELKSTNEELQSSNEELQSTNEELSTSKEELQSVNEELMTVNSEYEVKVAELAKANNDILNLLASTDVGTVFVDTKLCIQRFTPPATNAINLIRTDIGRPLAHIASNLDYERLVQDTEEVLNTLVPKETEAQSTEGLFYAVRIRPYRTLENVVEGAVVTFIDITERKRMEEVLRESEQRYRSLYEGCPDGYARLTMDGRIVESNKAFQEIVGYSEEELGKLIYRELTPKKWHKLDAEIAQTILTDGYGPLFHKEYRRKDGTIIPVELKGYLLKDNQDKPIGMWAFVRDLTERKKPDTD